MPLTPPPCKAAYYDFSFLIIPAPCVEQQVLSTRSCDDRSHYRQLNHLLHHLEKLTNNTGVQPTRASPTAGRTLTAILCHAALLDESGHTLACG